MEITLMKKIIIAALLSISPIYGMAAETGPGCGWGSMVFDGSDGLASHVMAATTNGSTGNQTFGMTSGTGGCDPSKPIQKMAYNFLDSNLDKVARDMATGNGESVTTLASLMGVPESKTSLFIKASKDNFGKIFARDDVRSVDVYAAIINMMRENNELAQYAS